MPKKRLSPEVLKELHDVATPIVKEQGAILFHEGEPCQGAFLIRSGEVKLSLDSPASVYPDRTVGSGFLIGLPATFSGEPYSLTAEVKKDCSLDFIPRPRLMDLLNRSPQTGLQVVTMLSDEISLMRNVAKRAAMRKPQRHSFKPTFSNN